MLPFFPAITLSLSSTTSYRLAPETQIMIFKFTEYKVLGNVHVYCTLTDKYYSLGTKFQHTSSMFFLAYYYQNFLERQLFDNFIYTFSDFIFKIKNSIWIKMYSYKVRESKTKELYP